MAGEIVDEGGCGGLLAGAGRVGLDLGLEQSWARQEGMRSWTREEVDEMRVILREV